VTNKPTDQHQTMVTRQENLGVFTNNADRATAEVHTKEQSISVQAVRFSTGNLKLPDDINNIDAIKNAEGEFKRFVNQINEDRNHYRLLLNTDKTKPIIFKSGKGF